jgi:hypothetical protein
LILDERSFGRFEEWADRATPLLEKYGAIPTFIPAKEWVHWATIVCALPAISGQTPPMARIYSDWKSWAQDFNRVIEPQYAPAALTGLTATPISATRIDLAWTVARGAIWYTVIRNGAQIVSGLTLNSYSNTGLTTGTTYTYSVYGVNNVGAGVRSVDVSATTP